ncbi:MAG TPA: 7-carboxy-7-deazaguanine synthase QueE [Ignavibacteria bacterium]|nr:7-carboxy-7-deazaguanine synthase QueE [Ignavibacteria bacterium]HRF67114.1 7-carboxy-7-deazaguanine synthase QueE [Ignavibacteria bacterium]HRJ04450.1 7-carboxy-7-deazaguanine synthase QueE [Ignavibacteria bacterium]
MLKINEIFHSIQGESTKAGLPCVFVRLTYCNIRCVYCDTEYAFYEGVDRSIDDIVDEVKSFNCRLVEITGGEPLVQENVHILIKELCDLGYEVLIETGGSLPIENIDKRVKIIMDLKTPYSRMEKKNRYENIQHLKSTDEVKFVIGSREDYEWVKDIILTYDLLNKVEQVLLSPVFDKVENIQLAEWILQDKLNVRFQLQMHKYIWHPETRGV